MTSSSYLTLRDSKSDAEINLCFNALADLVLEGEIGEGNADDAYDRIVEEAGLDFTAASKVVAETLKGYAALVEKSTAGIRLEVRTEEETFAGMETFYVTGLDVSYDGSVLDAKAAENALYNWEPETGELLIKAAEKAGMI